MPHKYTVRYRVTAKLAHSHPATTLAGLLDMLRYDGSTVEKWDIAHTDRALVVTLELSLTDRTPTFDRWASMGIIAEEIG